MATQKQQRDPWPPGELMMVFKFNRPTFWSSNSVTDYKRWLSIMLGGSLLDGRRVLGNVRAVLKVRVEHLDIPVTACLYVTKHKDIETAVSLLFSGITTDWKPHLHQLGAQRKDREPECWPRYLESAKLTLSTIKEENCAELLETELSEASDVKESSSGEDDDNN